MYETFVFNLGGGVRQEMLNGRLYLVARCVMGVEGVLHGTNGPGFYPAKEWENGVPSWNMKPITNDHPTKDGKPISAADKSVIETSQLGFLLNTSYGDNKLRTEAWFDSQHTQQRCPAVYGALLANKMVEVSTGLFIDQDKTAGDHKGRKYDWIARNHRPDHLAVLPNKVGACSIADGAGLLANEAMTVENLLIANEDLLKRLNQPPKEPDVEKKTLVDNLISKSGGLWAEDSREWLMGRDVNWLQKAVAGLQPATPPAPAPAPPAPAPVSNTVQEWLQKNNAPPQVVTAVNNLIANENQQKAQLVTNILAAPGNAFTKEWLMEQDLPVLIGMEKLAAKPTPATPTNANGTPILQPNYSGLAPAVPTPLPQPGAQPQLPVLALPTLNFQTPGVKTGGAKIG